MQTIKAFKTDDGQIFESKQDAEAHERHAKFAAWYNEDPFTITRYGDEDFNIAYEELTEWLKRRNASIVRVEEC
jgi:hypothetical protein